MVQQANHTWVGCLLILVICGAVLFGITLTSTDLLNWNAHAVSADATRASLNQQAVLQDASNKTEATAAAGSAVVKATADAASVAATATQIALQTANDQSFAHATQIALVLAPTQQAAVMDFDNRQRQQSDVQTATTVKTSATILMSGLTVALVAIALAFAVRLVLNTRTRLLETQAQLLREKRHTIEVEVAIERLHANAMTKEQSKETGFSQAVIPFRLVPKDKEVMLSEERKRAA